MSAEHPPRGKHAIAEFHGVPFDLLNNPDTLALALTTAVRMSGATILATHVRQFEPQGVTVLVELSESHASIHTYPEAGVMFVDVFTCGDLCDPLRAVKVLGDLLRVPSGVAIPGYRVDVIDRGVA